MSEIFQLLPFFNQTGPVFRDLVGDPNRNELDPVQAINDINKGAIENSIEWHLRFQRRAVHEVDLRNARGIFLRKWAEIYGIPRPPSMSDEDFIGYMIGRILSVSSARPALVSIFPEPKYQVFGCAQVGAFLDVCYYNVGVQDPKKTKVRMASSVLTFGTNSIYVYVKDPDHIGSEIKKKLYDTLAAGFAVYAGVY